MVAADVPPCSGLHPSPGDVLHRIIATHTGRPLHTTMIVLVMIYIITFFFGLFRFCRIMILLLLDGAFCCICKDFDVKAFPPWYMWFGYWV